MHIIYLDTTDHLILGLLNEKGEWLSYEDKGPKSQSSMFEYIHNMLEKHNISFKDIDKLFYCAGPGSYTGMRCGFGLSQLTDWYGIETHAFVHFEIPKLLGETEGMFISKAYKNELFTFEWNGQKNTTKLLALNKEELPEELLSYNGKFYTSFIKQLPNEMFLKLGIEQTSTLINKNMTKLIHQLTLQQNVRSPYYYRAPEVEFKVSNYHILNKVKN